MEQENMMLSGIWYLVLFVLTRLTLTFGAPEVQLKNTIVSGVSVPDPHLELFGGIPFAEPPVGALRFAPPIIRLHPGVPNLNATQYGPACSQGFGFGTTQAQVLSQPMSEDCLTLNILRPADLPEDTLVPVMFWVYGGGFQNGAAFLTNGTALVGQSIERGSPVIFVSINYRLGPLGFPQGAESEANGALNLGNKDIITALKWVQCHIAAFGGDKDKVTIFGISAGSILISELLLDPEFNLARAAILQSGSPASNMIFNTSSRAFAWETLVSVVPECDGASANSTFDCLRRASVETIINATNYVFTHVPAEFPFSPVIDGSRGLIPDLPSRILKKGRFARIPVITGTSLDEGTIFIPISINSTELLRVWIVSNATSPVATVANHNPVLDKILDLYPNIPALGSPFGTGNETFGLSPIFKRAAALFGDVGFVSTRRELAQAYSDHGVKVFAYLFTDPQTANGPTFPGPMFGVRHAADLPYVFGTTQNGPASTILSRNMIDYWISFATSLDPNDGLGNSSRPVWTRYTASSKDVLQLDSRNSKMIPDTFREKQIAYLMDIAETLHH